MQIPAAFSFASVLPLGVLRLAGLRRFVVFSASSARPACASSSLLGSVVHLRSLPVLAAGSNPALKRTGLRPAAYLVR